MKRRLLILGEVHDVGYRPFLLGIAEGLEIERFFADNLRYDNRKAVHVLIDSTEDKVEEFIQMVKSRYPEDARVDDMKIEPYSGTVMKIETYYRYLSSVQLSKIATIGRGMLHKQDEHIELTKDILHKQDEHIELTKGILHKQDEHIELTKDILHKQDEHIELTKDILHKQDEHIELTKGILHKQDEHIELTKDILHKQDEHIELTKEILHGQDKHIQITEKGFSTVTEKLSGYRELREEIRELKGEFIKLKESLREAGISVG